MFAQRVGDFLAQFSLENFGVKVTDGYRTREQQERAYAAKPGLAARPGTSLHERGLAVDIEAENVRNEDKLRELMVKRDTVLWLTSLGLQTIPGEPWHIEAMPGFYGR